MARAVIFGGGCYGSEFPCIVSDDYIIAADAGYEILEEKGIVPDITVGDFDSSEKIPEENAVILPVEKDVTDTHAAVNIALQKGFDEIVIYGGMGGRPDHTFANITLVAFLAVKGVRASCVGEGYTVSAVMDGALELEGKTGKTVSVFSWTEKCEGVTLEGLKYPLEKAELTNTYALGVSNSFIENKARISVEKGILIVMAEN